MKLYSILIASLLFSSSAFADFNLVGEGKITYPTGIDKPFTFGFAWDEQNKKFKIGNKSYNMSSLPESYSIALTLSKDDEKVWVQEFNAGFIDSFEWQLGEQTITLKKKKFKVPVKGDYVLSLNKTDYFLVKNNVSIQIKFKEDGIDNIKN
ncbi:hypothetical protein [Pseudoalteromonas phenolica]|uniref:hypothetical protein n=1 Tax=Pseudoalteromonas phenolica TaxID=161398 RepID=UPI0030C7E828